MSMTIREIENLLGHSLDDDQSNRDFNYDRGQNVDLDAPWPGIKSWRRFGRDSVDEESVKKEGATP